MKKIMFAIFVIGIVLYVPYVPVHAVSVNEVSIQKAVQYLRSQQQIDGHIDGFGGVTDWAAMAFSATGNDIHVMATGSGQTLQQYLTTNPPTNTSQSTEWSRKILSFTSTNLNPYDIEGVDYIASLAGYYNNGQIGNVSTVNDDIFGLLAFLSANVPIDSTMLTDTLLYIISHQHDDGGFSYSTDDVSSDIDDTAAAIMALQAAKVAGMNASDIDESIDAAKAYILSHQNTDGGFAYDPNPETSWDTTSNISSSSWAVMALASLRLNSDVHFADAQNYIISTQQLDGSFPYQPIYPPGDTFDTSFAVLALTGASWPIHIYSGVVPMVTSTPSPVETISSTSTPALTSTPTPIPASQPLPTSTVTPTPAPVLIVVETLPVEVKNAIAPEPTIAVLGVQSDTSEKRIRAPSWRTKLFFGLGTIFLLGFFVKLFFIIWRKQV